MDRKILEGNSPPLASASAHLARSYRLGRIAEGSERWKQAISLPRQSLHSVSRCAALSHLLPAPPFPILGPKKLHWGLLHPSTKLSTRCRARTAAAASSPTDSCWKAELWFCFHLNQCKSGAAPSQSPCKCWSKTSLQGEADPVCQTLLPPSSEIFSAFLTVVWFERCSCWALPQIPGNLAPANQWVEAAPSFLSSKQETYKDIRAQANTVWLTCLDSVA